MRDPIEFRCTQCGKEPGNPCVSVTGVDLYHHARAWAAEDADLRDGLRGDWDEDREERARGRRAG